MVRAILTNPLDQDPVLKDLLRKLDLIETRRGFARWKKHFLMQFESHLEGVSITRAGQKYHAFARRLDRLVLLLKALERLISAGDLSVAKVTVKARQSLGELQKQLTGMIQHTQALVPGTLEQENVMGYTKFDMGAVLVRDGFVEYDRLSLCRDVLQHMTGALLHKVADRQLLEEMERYEQHLQVFCDIMGNDLGLHGAMVKCRDILRSEDEEFYQYEKVPRNRGRGGGGTRGNSNGGGPMSSRDGPGNTTSSSRNSSFPSEYDDDEYEDDLLDEEDIDYDYDDDEEDDEEEDDEEEEDDDDSESSAVSLCGMIIPLRLTKFKHGRKTGGTTTSCYDDLSDNVSELSDDSGGSWSWTLAVPPPPKREGSRLQISLSSFDNPLAPPSITGPSPPLMVRANMNDPRHSSHAPPVMPRRGSYNSGGGGGGGAAAPIKRVMPVEAMEEELVQDEGDPDEHDQQGEEEKYDDNDYEPAAMGDENNGTRPPDNLELRGGASTIASTLTHTVYNKSSNRDSGGTYNAAAAAARFNASSSGAIGGADRSAKAPDTKPTAPRRQSSDLGKAKRQPPRPPRRVNSAQISSTKRTIIPAPTVKFPEFPPRRPLEPIPDAKPVEQLKWTLNDYYHGGHNATEEWRIAKEERKQLDSHAADTSTKNVGRNGTYAKADGDNAEAGDEEDTTPTRPSSRRRNTADRNVSNDDIVSSKGKVVLKARLRKKTDGGGGGGGGGGGNLGGNNATAAAVDMDRVIIRRRGKTGDSLDGDNTTTDMNSNDDDYARAALALEVLSGGSAADSDASSKSGSQSTKSSRGPSTHGAAVGSSSDLDTIRHARRASSSGATAGKSNELRRIGRRASSSDATAGKSDELRRMARRAAKLRRREDADDNASTGSRRSRGSTSSRRRRRASLRGSAGRVAGVAPPKIPRLPRKGIPCTIYSSTRLLPTTVATTVTTPATRATTTTTTRIRWTMLLLARVVRHRRPITRMDLDPPCSKIHPLIHPTLHKEHSNSKTITQNSHRRPP